MDSLKRIAKALLARTPYRISRTSPNRFDAIETCLRNLARAGYRPVSIIDGGAHLGSFATMAKAIFPGSVLHMIEPQPACRSGLLTLADRAGFTFHPVALGAEPGEIRLWVSGDAPSTGSSVAAGGEQTGTVPVRCESLDALFATDPSVGDDLLLKLDLQGYELEALKGAAALMPRIEVILTEVSFFAQAYEPPIAMLVATLDAAGFDLFDIAALSGRRRDDRLRQGDFVFVRRGSPLLADTRWE